MELKRCARCGSFFTSDSEVCQLCNKKDSADVLKLKNFLEENNASIKDKEQISMHTGISLKNINRYLSMEEFNDLEFESINLTENKKEQFIELL